MSDEIYLTQTAYQGLLDELEDRKGPVRDDIVKRVAAAREEGDLKENGGYHAARDEQGMNEARIREIEHIIAVAEVGTPTDANADGKYEVTPGMVVEAKMSTSDRVLKFVLGARENAVDGIDAFSPSSPLGAAVLGKQEGEKATYKAPSGREIEVTITSVQPL
jgi:transcription elongation factor GreA